MNALPRNTIQRRRTLQTLVLRCMIALFCIRNFWTFNLSDYTTRMKAQAAQKQQTAEPQDYATTISYKHFNPSKVLEALPQAQQQDPVLFVHVGKAGGSSIRELLPKAHAQCTQKEQLPSTTNTPYFCTLARLSPKGQFVHIWNNQNAYHKYSNFLLPVRNPIDRLVSWFNFEGLVFENPKTVEEATFYYPFARDMYKCYNTFHGFVTAVLLPHQNQTKSATGTTTGNGTANDDNDDYPPYFYANREQCLTVGRQCLFGEKRCIHHNYYNNEVYMENLVHWKACHNKIRQQQQQQQHQQQQQQQHQLQEQELFASHNETDDNQTQNYPCEPRNIRIDVIRQESPEADLFRILDLWGIPPNATPEDEGFGYKKMNSLEQAQQKYQTKPPTGSLPQNNNNHKKYIGPIAVRALCEAICPELLVYKSIVAFAANLDAKDVADAYRDLDEKCLVPVDELCGTEFQYRNYKKLRGIVK